MYKMVVISVFILLIIFESSKVLSNAFNTYCSLPCPFTGPAQPPCSCGAIQLPARRSRPMARASFYDAYSDYDEIPEESQPLPSIRSRQQPAKPDPPPPPKPKPKSPPEDTKPPPEEPEPPPPPKKKCSSPPPSPSIQPSRRFFTSLFSIPGAVVDTMIGGEVTL